MEDFENSNAYWSYPISVRSRFQQVVSWWPERDASFPLVKVNATFAKMQRDRAALAQGYRAGNFALVLLQTLVVRAVDAGALSSNRVKQVPKLAPLKGSPSRDRRQIKPIRGGLLVENNLAKAENSTA